ncbi:putative nuclease HARBI1 [Tanacetum coccineum]
MNPFFPMNQNNDDDEERQPIVFEIDEETDVYFLEQAYAYHQQLVAEENRPRLTRNPINRDREGGEERLMADYFNDHCRVRPDATGRMSLSVIMQYTAAIRQLAYRTTPNAFDEYLQMISWQGQYGRGDKKYPTIMLEAVALQDLWIWHAFFGVAGANNDINVLDNSPLFDDLLDDKAPVAPYVVNGVEFEKGYYLADGIYPQWATFVKSFTVANDAKHAYFKKRQEGARKDVERDFGVLQGRSFASILKSGKPNIVSHEQEVPSLVLDDMCFLERDFNLSLMGKVKDISALPNIYVILKEEETFNLPPYYVEDVLTHPEENVLTHPEENVVAQLLTDEEIIESVIGINKDDIDEEDDESSTMEPPSRNEAIKAAITLNNFLLSYEKTTPEVLTMLRKIRDEIQGEIDFNKKQKTIESFFKKPS